MDILCRDLHEMKELARSHELEAVVIRNDVKGYAILFHMKQNVKQIYGLKCKPGKGRKSGLRRFAKLDTIARTLRQELGFEEFSVRYDLPDPESKPAFATLFS